MFLIPRPWFVTSKARAAATEAMALFSRFLISSVSDNDDDDEEEEEEEDGCDCSVEVTMLGMLEVTTTLEVTDEVSLTLEEVVTTLDTDTVFTAGT